MFSTTVMFEHPESTCPLNSNVKCTAVYSCLTDGDLEHRVSWCCWSLEVCDQRLQLKSAKSWVP